MCNFNVKIVEDDGDVHIYTDASMIDIEDGKIKIDYKDQHATHLIDTADEIVIKPKR